VGVEVDPGDVPCRSDVRAISRDMAAAHPASRHRSPLFSPALSRSSSVEGRMASESRSSRCLPSFPPAIA
jgi:hypothetical protein